MKTLVGSLLVTLAFAVAFAACERIVVLTPFPGGGGDDGGHDSFSPDAHVGSLPDAFVPLD